MVKKFWKYITGLTVVEWVCWFVVVAVVTLAVYVGAKLLVFVIHP